MGGVRKATRPHKLTQKKKPKKEQSSTEKKSSEKTDRTNKSTYEGELVDESPINRGRALNDNGIQRVSSERVYPSPKKLSGSRKELNEAREENKPTGPKSITSPGPTASEGAKAKAEKAKKGTKNTSTIKVAQPSIDLEEGPSFGKPVYTITDVPRQWNKNG
jgi:hypothetical protein